MRLGDSAVDGLRVDEGDREALLRELQGEVNCGDYVALERVANDEAMGLFFDVKIFGLDVTPSSTCLSLNEHRSSKNVFEVAVVSEIFRKLFAVISFSSSFDFFILSVSCIYVRLSEVNLV
ncbi:hypothetical protein H6P81_017745 [Aristolochia fimbriata]|uniref:Uncharacterized protein n=1 Tax=Aristolochia fimbriata TaxID=158543 RepID=A0AAV7E0I3_ARIFI|nr:hypothetical protein H6P81_017745 [Aristolochia fimbriata]